MASLRETTDLPRLPPRPADSNKGRFGRALIIAGSYGMSGAAVLCGSAALRGGAGLVRIAVPSSILPIVAAGNPCYMTLPLPHDDQGRIAESAESALLDQLQASNVAAIGPGLGRSDGLTRLLSRLIAGVVSPIVLDADGLNAFAADASQLKNHQSPLIITPHPGEFARLINSDIKNVQNSRRELAAQFAEQHGIIVVLKGHETIVTDGQQVYINNSGNPGMATGGSGDVLTGLIAALLGQGLEAFAAAQLGVWLHGVAGDLARGELGEIGMIASDLIDYLPHAFLFRADLA